MSEPVKLFDVNSGPTLSNADMSNVGEGSFRDSTVPAPATMPVMNPRPVPPPPPPMPKLNGYDSLNGYSGGMMGSYGMGGYGGFGGYGNYGMGGGFGMGGFGMGGMGGMSPYGGYNRFGPMYPGDIESRFIQIAEDSTRPAFDSIQSLVHAVGSVAMMMENTFFALTSSFRAILGVAENFGRLRSLFAQFWSTFAVVRTLNWLIRKLLVILGIRTECEFKAWADAVAATQAGTATPEQQRKGSSWPILLFFGVIAAAPYIVLRMMRGVTSAINEKLNDPKTWQSPLRAIASYDYTATSPQELSFKANQVITLASQSLQGRLWQTGWVMGTTDNITAALVPVNYIKVIKPSETTEHNQTKDSNPSQPGMTNLEQFYSNDL